MLAQVQQRSDVTGGAGTDHGGLVAMTRRVLEQHAALRELALGVGNLAEEVARGGADAETLHLRCAVLRRAVLDNALAEHDLARLIKERDPRATELSPYLAQIHRQHAEWIRRLAEQALPREGWELTLAVTARSVAAALLEDLRTTWTWLGELLDPSSGQAA